jgi:hypothetical protein
MTQRQRSSTPATRYSVMEGKRPKDSDGYPQRIEIWDALKHLGSATRSELLRELQKRNHKRPKNAIVDENYCRIEMTDMTRRGFLRRLD